MKGKRRGTERDMTGKEGGPVSVRGSVRLPRDARMKLS